MTRMVGRGDAPTTKATVAPRNGDPNLRPRRQTVVEPDPDGNRAQRRLAARRGITGEGKVGDPLPKVSVVARLGQRRGEPVTVEVVVADRNGHNATTLTLDRAERLAAGIRDLTRSRVTSVDLVDVVDGKHHGVRAWPADVHSDQVAVVVVDADAPRMVWLSREDTLALADNVDRLVAQARQVHSAAVIDLAARP